MRYSEAHKRAIIKKAIEADGKGLDQVARENGIHPATLGRWMQKFRNGTLQADGSDGIQPSCRNTGEKLMLLLESKTLVPESRGEWLRHHGLHTEHLRLWEQELMTMATGSDRKDTDESAQLRKENRQLKKELARKEKALAEAAVLLTLKKNFPTLFEDDEEA
jgi:transposase-like protein